MRSAHRLFIMKATQSCAPAVHTGALLFIENTLDTQTALTKQMFMPRCCYTPSSTPAPTERTAACRAAVNVCGSLLPAIRSACLHALPKMTTFTTLPKINKQGRHENLAKLGWAGPEDIVGGSSHSIQWHPDEAVLVGANAHTNLLRHTMCVNVAGTRNDLLGCENQLNCTSGTCFVLSGSIYCAGPCD